MQKKTKSLTVSKSFLSVFPLFWASPFIVPSGALEMFSYQLSENETAPNRPGGSLGQCLWCKYSHCGHHQATEVNSLRSGDTVGLGNQNQRPPHHWFLQKGKRGPPGAGLPAAPRWLSKCEHGLSAAFSLEFAQLAQAWLLFSEVFFVLFCKWLTFKNTYEFSTVFFKGLCLPCLHDIVIVAAGTRKSQR